MGISIVNGRVLTHDGVIGELPIHLQSDRIVGLGGPVPATHQTFDAQGALVLPGIIDLHGDAFERQILPRPGVHFPVDLALLETDRQMLANGITTAFHGITYSWEPGLRGRDTALALIDAIETLRPRLRCDTRIHLRWETFNLDGESDVTALIRDRRIDLLAFNDHAAHIGQHIAAGNRQKISEYTNRTGLSHDAFLALFDTISSRAGEVPHAITRLAQQAAEAGIACASHDDETIEMRSWFHELNIRLSEFPVNSDIARFAKAHDDVVILGAPNVVRNGSHCQRLCAATAVHDQLCDVLTSDYYYPSLMVAIFMLIERSGTPIGELWPLVSTRPAMAVNLNDRGMIKEGFRADLVVIDDRNPALPEAIATFVAGRPVYETQWRAADS